MDHDILQWHTKHFRGPSKPNKKNIRLDVQRDVIMPMFPSFAGIKSETKHQLMQRIRI